VIARLRPIRAALAICVTLVAVLWALACAAETDTAAACVYLIHHDGTQYALALLRDPLEAPLVRLGLATNQDGGIELREHKVSAAENRWAHGIHRGPPNESIPREHS